MYELADLYQQLIIDHNRSPRNRRRIEAPSGTAEGYNPLCGDRVTISLVLDGDVIRDVAFEGSGCAISTAAASLLTQSVKGKTTREALALFGQFHALVAGNGNRAGDVDEPPLGKLEAFAGVRQFPARIKCATLAWHTLKAALERRHDVVTTE